MDTRFAKDQSYLFFAQFVTETQLARNSMSIQLRKGKPITRDGRKISNRLLQDKREVERLVHKRRHTVHATTERRSILLGENFARSTGYDKTVRNPYVFLHVQRSRNEMA